MEAGGLCPKCGAYAVEFDMVAGMSACEACGAVLGEEELVHQPAFDAGGPAGTVVGATDTGERAAAYALHASGTGLAIQRSKRGGGEAKLKGRVREFGALLCLAPAVLEQSVHVAEQAVPHVLGAWRRDYLAAAATYAACRLNTLPLTLADLSGATQIDVQTLGRYYRSICRLLGLQPPLLLAADLLPRLADRVTADPVRRGTLAASMAQAVQRDAAELLGWMERQLEGRNHPVACVGAAVVLAAEMNAVSLSLDHVSTSLQLARKTLERKLVQVRQRLVQLAAFLPYSAAINTRNAGSHARTIIRLSALVGSTDGGGSGQGALQQLPPAAQQEQQPQAQQQEQEQRQEQQLQPAGNRHAAPPAGQQQDAGEDAAAQRHKRQRTEGPVGTAACGPAEHAAVNPLPAVHGRPKEAVETASKAPDELRCGSSRGQQQQPQDHEPT